MAGCKPADSEPLGPSASFLLLDQVSGAAAPVSPGDAPSPVVQRTRKLEGTAGWVTAALTEGFAAELMRTVFVTQEYIRNLRIEDAQPPTASALAWAGDVISVVIGSSNVSRPQRGFQLAGPWIGGPVRRSQNIWIAVPGGLRDRPAVAAHLTTVLARLLGEAAATAGSFAGPTGPLPDAYQMAMEVISREWRGDGSGARGAAPPRGNEAAAELFAGVRENRFVLQADRKSLRPAEELLADPRVAATVIYRMSQDSRLMKSIAPEIFYAPLANDRVPPGVSPAAVLGAFRNLQMKLLGSWIQAARRNQPPQNIAELVDIYSRQFASEREQVLRLFLAITFGATVKPGGITQAGPEIAQAEVNNLLADVIAGKTTLTAALNTHGSVNP